MMISFHEQLKWPSFFFITLVTEHQCEFRLGKMYFIEWYSTIPIFSIVFFLLHSFLIHYEIIPFHTRKHEGQFRLILSIVDTVFLLSYLYSSFFDTFFWLGKKNKPKRWAPMWRPNRPIRATPIRRARAPARAVPARPSPSTTRLWNWPTRKSNSRTPRYVRPPPSSFFFHHFFILNKKNSSIDTTHDDDGRRDLAKKKKEEKKSAVFQFFLEHLGQKKVPGSMEWDI